ncbi:MAG: MATE family efflux transporter, partial [Streptococcus gallolyticus]|nr:MATE family efflux transporter [Streptococcus gallolyticus]
MIDSIYIGHIDGIGAACLTALAIAFPLMNLSAAFGSLIGAGGSTLVSIKLGEKDNEAADWVLGNVISLNIIVGLLLMVFGLCFLDEILVIFGATEDAMEPAKDFMTIILLGGTVTHLFLGLNNVMRASGNPNTAMLNTLLTVVLNIILAPLFIYVFDLGIKGAALATITSQFCSLCLLFHFFKIGKSILRISVQKLRLRMQIFRSIFSIGVAPFMLNALACLVAIIMNNSLGKYGGGDAIAAYGIVFRVMTIGAMIVLGLNQGMQPIAGYNYGARNMDRVRMVFRTTVIRATVVMVCLFACCQLFPSAITAIFSSEDGNEKLFEMSEYGLRVASLMMPLVGFQMVTVNFFQSIGRAKISLMMSSTRQLLILIPLLLILPRFFGIDGVWFSLPVSDFIS